MLRCVCDIVLRIFRIWRALLPAPFEQTVKRGSKMVQGGRGRSSSFSLMSNHDGEEASVTRGCPRRKELLPGVYHLSRLSSLSRRLKRSVEVSQIESVSLLLHESTLETTHKRPDGLTGLSFYVTST